MSEVRPFYLSGVPTWGEKTAEVTSPWDGSPVATVSIPTPEQIERAVADLDAVRADAVALPAHVRAGALDHISRRLAERAVEIASLITAESGKPAMWARGEVNRAVSTFRWAAEEARRFSGELQRLDTDPGGTGRLALVRRFPRGPVLGIAPFNFPLNLVAHKVAPALAVGAPILVKPALKTPLSALVLAEIIAETDLPPRMVSVLTVQHDSMDSLLVDPRLPVVSLTGSETVGDHIRRTAPHKHVVLELGGDAAVMIEPDWPDLKAAAARVALFGCYQAGQSCISVQRVFAHEAIYDEFVAELASAVAALTTGDPTDPSVQVGPVIDDAAAERITSWVRDATDKGATLLVGGGRDGRQVAPTLLADVPAEATIAHEEVFGPVLTVRRYRTTAEGFALVNASRYGLQAGVFTTRLDVAFAAHRELVVGGVVIGDVPTYRADQMPYGGWKKSGVGREGRQVGDDRPDRRPGSGVDRTAAVAAGRQAHQPTGTGSAGVRIWVHDTAVRGHPGNRRRLHLRLGLHRVGRAHGRRRPATRGEGPHPAVDAEPSRARGRRHRHRQDEDPAGDGRAALRRRGRRCSPPTSRGTCRGSRSRGRRARSCWPARARSARPGSLGAARRSSTPSAGRAPASRCGPRSPLSGRSCCRRCWASTTSRSRRCGLVFHYADPPACPCST